jgi:hypothetical protein
VSRLRSGLAAAALLAATAAMAPADDVVVLKGGGVITLRQPWVRKGNTAYLTRPDGTILSVSVSEIDRDATAAARAKLAAPPPPANPPAEAPATPAEAARAKEEAPKARVRITDSDVSHPLDFSDPAVAGKEKDKDKDKKEYAPGSARVEISTYDQKRDGDGVIVSGKLRNPTQQLAESVRLVVTILDEKGEPIDAGVASLTNGDIDPGSEVDFKVRILVGEKTPGTLRFAPTWQGPKPTPVPPSPRPAGQRPASNTSRS